MTNRIISFLFSVSTKDHSAVGLVFLKMLFKGKNQINISKPKSKNDFLTQNLLNKFPKRIFNTKLVPVFCVEEV